MKNTASGNRLNIATGTVKKWLLAAGVILVVIGMAAFTATHHDKSERVKQQPATAIVITEPQQGGTLKNGSAISGTFEPKPDSTLYYVVSDSTGKALGAGNILPNHVSKFSRSASFNPKQAKSNNGQLVIYLQGKDGKRLATSKVAVIFEQ